MLRTGYRGLKWKSMVNFFRRTWKTSAMMVPGKPVVHMVAYQDPSGRSGGLIPESYAPPLERVLVYLIEGDDPPAYILVVSLDFDQRTLFRSTFHAMSLTEAKRAVRSLLAIGFHDGEKFWQLPKKR